MKFLEVYTSRRVLVLVALGFASGLPYDLLRGTLSLRLHESGIDIKSVAAFGWIALVFNFKLVWSPLLDRFSTGFLGRRRGWILVTQLLLVASIFAMGMLEPQDRLMPFVLITLVTAFLSATQDIVIDAYRTDVLPAPERGAGAATYTFGFRIAMLAGGAVTVYLKDHLPWGTVYMIAAFGMLIGIAATFMSPAPTEVVTSPKTLKEAVVEPLRDFFTRNGAWAILAFILFFRFGEGMAGQLLNPFLGEGEGGLGFRGQDIALKRIIGMVTAIVGAFAGGGLIGRYGTFRPLLLFGIFQALANVGYFALAFIGKNIFVLGIAIGVDNFLGGMGTTAFVAFLMSICTKNYSVSQFALFTSASTLLAHMLGRYTGVLQEAVGWPGFFLVTILASAPGLIILMLFVPDPEAAETS